MKRVLELKWGTLESRAHSSADFGVIHPFGALVYSIKPRGTEVVADHSLAW